MSRLSKDGWEWVLFLEKWVGVGHFFKKIGRSELFLSKNGLEWVVFSEKWVGVCHFSSRLVGVSCLH